ncbi:MAG TPA: hypothetical protein VGP93_20435, partial [Polyangiaceae bacterium]|nr:hypothetical protein [Polyangiaceae bacterium]
MPRKRAKRPQNPDLLRKRPEHWIPTPLPERHGLLSHSIAYIFEELGVPVSLWLTRSWWQPIHVPRNLTNLEVEVGVASRRWPYNDRMLARARREHRAVSGELSGFRDLFVPVEGPDGLYGVLVFGPYLPEIPSGSQVAKAWRKLSGSEGRMTDTGFVGYLTEVLDALAVEGAKEQAFFELASCFARCLAGLGDAKVLAGEVDQLRSQLVPLRYPERMWALVQRLLAEHSFRRPAPLDHGDMAIFGVRHMPRHVIVGYLTGKGRDPIDETIRRARFQRSCAVLARERGRVLCGRVGREGIALLLDSSHRGERAKR